MMRLVLTSLITITALGVSAATPGTTRPWASLTEDELLAEFTRAGLALRDTLAAPMVFPSSSAIYSSRNYLSQPVLGDAAREIIRRGNKMMPRLLTLVEAEAQTRRPPDKNGVVPSFTEIELDMLSQIGDPRAVPVALKLLAGMDGGGDRIDDRTRRPALEAVENLTFCSMHKMRPVRSNYPVQHPNAIAETSFKDLDTAAAMYREWLNGEGKDASQWLQIARQRAISQLDSDDPDLVFCAAAFLAAHDKTAATANRVGELIDKLVWTHNARGAGGRDQTIVLHRGKRSDLPIDNWIELLAAFGPLAQPHSRTLISIQKELGENNWDGYRVLGAVGGPEIMDYLIDVLPRIGARVAEIKADPNAPKGFSSKNPRGWWLDSQVMIRDAIDRAAGQKFPDDAARITWWKHNRTQPLESPSIPARPNR
jgi:hypothetical protein